MNLVLVTRDGELVTPGLGTILEGVTRDSVLELAAEHGLSPVERRVGLDELRSGCRDSGGYHPGNELPRPEQRPT